MKKTNGKYYKYESAVLILSICKYGLFYEGFAGIAGAVLLVLLGLKSKDNKSLVIPESLLMISMIVLPAAALATSLWAIDRGMSLLGFLKYLPVAVWILLIAAEKNDNPERKEKLLTVIPYTVTAVTLIGMFAYITPLKEYFFIKERFSGVFQYANSYALLLLISLIILLWGNYGRIQTILMTVVFITAIIATGCRAVFFLMILSVLVWIGDSLKDRVALKKGPVIVIALIILFSVVIGILTDDMYGFARFTKLNFDSSSFSSRILYNIDGLKMLFDHPLGLGYKGFSFYQGAVQTGNYAATFAHNDLLQIALDFGVLMGLIVGAGYVLMIIKKGLSTRNRLILVVCGMHGLFDWSLQFPVLLMVLVLVSDWDQTIKVSIKGVKKVILVSVAAVSILITCWLGTASILEYAGAYEAASGVYPGLTTSQMYVISSTQSDTVKYGLAEKIVKRNNYCTIALQAMAEKSAREGNLPAMAEYALKAVKSSKYNTSGYEIYLYFLSFAAEASNNAGDAVSTMRYLTMAADVENLIENVYEETHPLAKNLYNKPEIRLADEYEEYISQAKSLTE